MEGFPVSMTTQELIEAIHNAFAATPLPQELTSLSVKSNRPYEAEHLKRSFSGKTWQQISPATLHDCGSMLMYFTPEVFCYYLPVCLILTVDYYNSDFVGESTLYFFSIKGSEEAQREVLGLLTDRQKFVILHVFKYLHENYSVEEDYIPYPTELMSK